MALLVTRVYDNLREVVYHINLLAFVNLDIKAKDDEKLTLQSIVSYTEKGKKTLHDNFSGHKSPLTDTTIRPWV